MTIAISSGPISAVDSIQHELVVAIERSDREGLQLLIELALIRFGVDWTSQLVTELPSLVAPDRVPTALQFLHGSDWQRVARAICISASHDLVQIGVTLGVDVSLGITDDGTPILYMKRQVHDAIIQIAPHSLHLIGSFLQLQ